MIKPQNFPAAFLLYWNRFQRGCKQSLSLSLIYTVFFNASWLFIARHHIFNHFM